MCTVLLPPGDNPIAVNKYINMNIAFTGPQTRGEEIRSTTVGK